MDNGKLILGSASPRRSELLSRMGVDFTVDPADVDETTGPGISPVEAALVVARRKGEKISQRVGDAAWVLTADTVVALEGSLLGKPINDEDGRRMLCALSGRDHQVVTAVVLRRGEEVKELAVVTRVRFAALTPSEIDWYVATGEGLDKAGGYGIQGRAAGFVEEVEGSYTNVVGLPLAQTLELLRDAGIVSWAGR